MRYILKKSIFCLLAILSILLLLYWSLYDLGAASRTIVKLQTALDVREFFRGDGVMGPVIYTLIIAPFTSIVYSIFYRKACSLRVKLFPLFAGVLNSLTSVYIVSAIFTGRYSFTDSSIGLKLLLVIYAAIALAAIGMLIAAMVKYPKPEPNAV